ncbi:Transmembrane protein [Hirschfeldia incana]|nr:Transmembrane protein [Hirschfeldia incana]
MATDATTFPEGDAEAELNPGQNKSLQVDPVSSEIASDKIQKNLERIENAKAKRDATQTLKKTIIISAVIVAVAGAAFAITKKMKEK